MKRVIAIIALLFAVAGVRAQNVPTVTARIEPDSIFIGDRFDLVIDVEKDMVQTILFPTFETDKRGHIELVEEMPIDTVKKEGRSLIIRKRYRMAAFEEGIYNMGVAKVLYADKNIVDTLSSRDSLRLEVATFQIDSTSHSIYDIKPQKTLSFKFAEIKGYVKWGLLILAILAILAYALAKYLKRRGKRLADLFRPSPPQPPHVVAIRALEALHSRKLWQNSKHKEYYSGITDILRTYIAGRWGVGAMEMTSDEIIAAMRPLEFSEKARMDLTTILRDADLVKFAKDIPDAEQNENDYFKAYYFVEETKPEEEAVVSD